MTTIHTTAIAILAIVPEGEGNIRTCKPLMNQHAKQRTWTYRQQQVSYRSYIGMLTNTTTEGEVQIFHFAKYRFFTSQSTDFSFRKVQIFHFAKYRFFTSQSTDFSLRKVQIFIFTKYRFFTSQSTDFSFRFVSFRFAKYNKPIQRLKSAILFSCLFLSVFGLSTFPHT